MIIVKYTHVHVDRYRRWGVDTFFKTLAKLASGKEFSLAKSENNWPHLQK
jgi:hypothetical protein